MSSTGENSGSGPAIKDDLERAVSAIHDQISQLALAVTQIESRLKDRAEGASEFQRYANGVSFRIHAQETSSHDLGERMHYLEERVLELEARLRPKL